MSKLIEITSEAEFSSHLATISPSTLLVLYFFTPWTDFCTQMSTTMSTIASQYLAGDPPAISFVSINAKELLSIAKGHGVSKAPSVICLRNGQVLELIRGSNPIKVCDALNRHAGVNVTAVPAVTVLTSKESNDALNARLTQLVKAAPVMLFLKGTPNSPMCRFSRRLVHILSEHSIDYDYFNILADKSVREGLKEFGDWPTFPQLWVDGELVGGLEIVREELSTNPSFIGQYAVSKAVISEGVA